MLFLNHDLAFQIEEDLRKGNQQLIEAWNTLDSGASVQTIELDGILAVYGGPECPINEAVGLGMSSPVDGGTVTQIEEFYESYDYPTVIRICPLAHPSLIETMRERGYVLSSFEYRWMRSVIMGITA